MQNLIFTAYAEETIGQFTPNTDLYLQNACCCLLSAKRHNPNDQVALIANVEIPASYQTILKNAGVEVWVKPFDSFRIIEEFKWKLAFYKLCALSYAVNGLEYDKVLLLDTDVLTIGSYRELWHEADTYLLFHQVVHHYENANEMIMRREMIEILGIEDYIHWGGEFACGRSSVLKEVLLVAQEKFEQMLASGIYTTRGDEFIWSAALKGFKVKSSVAYLDRCWTGKEYYFTSTHMYYPGLVALHLPDEKKRGMLRLFKKLKKNQYPSKNQLFKMMRMPSRTCAFSTYRILDFYAQIKRKIHYIN